MIACNKVADKYPEVKRITIDDVNRVMGLNTHDIARVNYAYLDHDKAVEYINEMVKLAIAEINKNGCTPYDGASDMIKKLSKNHLIGIITNNQYVELLIKKLNLGGYIDSYIGTTSFKITKSEAIKIMKEKYNPTYCYYVGDIEKDMIASNEARATFIHARYGFQPNLKSKYYINDIKELEQLINEIES